MTLKELAIAHDYYCSDQNWNDASAMETYKTWNGFMADNEDMDIDLNLVFRFDVKLKNDENETEGYFMQLSVMQQRRGKYVPIIIETVTEEDVPSIVSYLSGHFEKMKQLWQPFSFLN
jgi:hypothetical protein